MDPFETSDSRGAPPPPPPPPPPPASAPGPRPAERSPAPDPPVDMSFDELRTFNEQLDQERRKAASDLERVKKQATRAIKRLKERADTATVQKENLLKQLALRDAGAEAPEVTLEQITSAPVFQTMLDNIKKTSREEVTLLHTAVKTLGKTDPAAYNAVLIVVDRTFKAAGVENPLALLPRLPTS